MSKTFKLLVICALMLSFTGSAFADEFADRLKERKYRNALLAGCEDIKIKDPDSALIFGLLPGGGSFYTRELGLAIVDFILYPVGSFLWDGALASNRANKMNKEETIFNCEMDGHKL